MKTPNLKWNLWSLRFLGFVDALISPTYKEGLDFFSNLLFLSLPDSSIKEEAALAVRRRGGFRGDLVVASSPSVAVQLLEPTAMAVQLLEPTASRSHASNPTGRGGRLPDGQGTVYQTVKGPSTRRSRDRLPDGQGTVYQTVKGPSPIGPGPCPKTI